MDSEAKASVNETAPFWTEEKHLHFLNNMEASFVRTMLHNNNNNNTATSTLHHHHHHNLRLNRHLPDTSDSTLDLKPQHYHRRRTTKYHAPSDRRAARKRSSQPSNSSSQDQVVPQIGNEREGAAAGHDDKVAEN